MLRSGQLRMLRIGPMGGCNSESGPEVVFCTHTNAPTPTLTSAHTNTHVSRQQKCACTEKKILDDPCTTANHNQRMHKDNQKRKTSPGRDDKARCVVVCCDTNAAVWHEWKWGWNAGGWGSKSYCEATCGATNAMEVCRSSAISCPFFAPH